MLQKAKQLQHARLSWHVSSFILFSPPRFQILGHGNPDNNLESVCSYSIGLEAVFQFGDNIHI
jgi:hypothetical protein